MNGNLEGQVAIVTGGSAGIGKSIARAFAAAGAHVVIFGTNLERGTQAAESLAEGRGSFMQVDVADRAAVDTAIADVFKEQGKIDILVNNAGITRDNLILRMKEEDWDRVLDVNLKSCFNTCKAVARPMLKQRRGRIILVSSVVGLTGNAGQVNYAASKAGMLGFAKSLAQELATRGITVNAIAPGFIDTRMTQELTEKQREGILSLIPMGRLGQPEEIASAALFLAGPGAAYITGQTLTVDGGMVM